MAEKGNLFTGARARFSISGVKVGFARNVTVREEIQLDPVEVLDNIEVEEYVPVADDLYDEHLEELKREDLTDG